VNHQSKRNRSNSKGDLSGSPLLYRVIPSNRYFNVTAQVAEPPALLRTLMFAGLVGQLRSAPYSPPYEVMIAQAAA